MFGFILTVGLCQTGPDLAPQKFLLSQQFKTNPNFSVTPKLRRRPRPVVISNEEIPSEIKPKSYPPRTGIHSITNPTSSSSSLGVQPNQLQHQKQHSASLEEKLDEIATK